MEIQLSKINEAALQLGIHVLVAAALFIVVSGVAVALNVLTVWCEPFASPWVIVGMRGLEMLTWALDVAGVTWLLLIQFVRFGSQVWAARKD